jgi:hypothetical protein
LKHEPVRAPGWPAFKITFVNDSARWVFCHSKKPSKHNPALLDTNLPENDIRVAGDDEAICEADGF